MSHSLCKIRRNATMDYFWNSPSHNYIYCKSIWASINIQTHCESDLVQSKLSFHLSATSSWILSSFFFYFCFRPTYRIDIQSKQNLVHPTLIYEWNYFMCYANSNCDLMEFNFNFHTFRIDAMLFNRIYTDPDKWSRWVCESCKYGDLTVNYLNSCCTLH